MSPNRASQHVGILAMDAYFPKQVVSQEDLEVADEVSTGKYTIGLGQKEMGFVAGDREDINSISMTAVSNLLEKVRVVSPALFLMMIMLCCLCCSSSIVSYSYKLTCMCVWV